MSETTLSWRARAGYGVGDLGINLYFQVALTFLLYFYTDVFGLAAGTVGTLFLVARIVDAVTDPMMGAVADRTHTRYGKLRPYLLFGPLPLALVAILTFTTPAREDIKVAWAFATYISFGVAYTVVAIPYSALTAVLTRDAHERTLLSTLRQAFAMVGGVIVGVCTPQLVEALGGGVLGYQRTAMLYAAAATLCIWTTFATTSEEVASLEAEAPSPRAAFSTLRDNRPLWIVIAIFVLGTLAFTLRQSAIVYFLKYNLGREDLLPVFFAASIVPILLGAAMTPGLTKRVGKARGLILGACVTIIGGLGVYLCPPERIELLLACFLVSAFGTGPLSVISWAMIPDTVEYGEWKHGVRAEGGVYSIASFGQKLSMASGGAAAGAVLAMTGYQPDAEQSEAALRGIAALVALLPVAAVALIAVLAHFYPLDENEHARILAELDAR